MTCHKCGHENLSGSKYCSQCAALLPRSGAAEGSSGGAGAGILLTVFIVVVMGGLMYMAFSSSVEGEIHARGKPFGTWSMKPTSCYSGQHQSFFGVWVAPDLKKSGGREGFKGGIKVMKSPTEEWNAYVESPLECQSFKCKVYELPQASCKVFDVEVRNTHNSVNDIFVLEGHIKLDCSTPEGGSLAANLEFDGCS